MIICARMVKSSSCMAAMTIKNQKLMGVDCTHLGMFFKDLFDPGYSKHIICLFIPTDSNNPVPMYILIPSRLVLLASVTSQAA